ncbi:ABC-type transport system, substrate-binding protein [Cryptosporangium aurantiacum]|uniref:ABC-type transport system, substrate-binding protein n=2 Tax=Cryptosporangium aurantiacum TaxID=134849 RepID=A0A1M7Q544_9ACTN|nr:ABC-type transport system, substrate-binding protein [Cryptosporangium aurantiacum]
MGIVYAGLDELPDGRERKVAVKVIHPHLADAPEFRTRFRSEATLAARVARFSTAAVLDVDVESEQPFLVTEFVDGPTLQEVVEDQGPLTGGALDAVAIGIATALVAIHEAGIVHRDLKPSNVILSRFGPRVIDFGIARAADAMSGLTSGAIGSPPYMAPEQFRGEAITPATDIHAWGAAVCFAGTGKPPFGIGAPEVMLYRTLEQAPELSALDETLRDLAGAALRKAPGERPSARDLLAALTLRRPDAAPSIPVPPLPAGASAAAGTAGAGTTGAGAGTAGAGTAGAGDAGAGDAGVTDVGAGDTTVRVASDGSPQPPIPAKKTRRRTVVLRTAAAAVVLAVLAGAAVLWVGQRGSDTQRSDSSPPAAASDSTVRQFSADDDATGPAPAVPGAVRGGTVELYAAADFWELDPVQNQYTDGMMASSRLLARTLTAYRENGSKEPTLVGDLATDTGRSTDGGRTWEFTIRSGVTFADGTPVTAQDVAHGIARAFSTRAKGMTYLQEWLTGRTDFRAVYSGPTSDAPYPPGVEAPNAQTLRLRFPAPHPDLPAVAALPFTAAVAATWKPRENDPVPITGPYRIASVAPDRTLTLTRNPAWKPETDPVRTNYPDRYVVRFGAERTDVTRLMMRDEAPAGVQLSTIDSSQADEAYQMGLDNRLVDGVGSGHRDLCFNTQRVPDVKQRRALSLAFNPESALAALGGNYVGDFTTSLLSPRLPGYPEDQSRALRSGNPAAASEALDGAEVTLVFAHKDTGEHRRLATAVVTAFARAGVTVVPRPVKENFLAAIGRADNPYDLYLCEWTPDYLDGNAMLPHLYSSRVLRTDGNTNMSYLRVEAVDAELDRIAALPDRTRAAREYAAFANRLRTEWAPAIPFFDQRRWTLTGSNVRGVFVSKLWAVPDLARVWVQA